MTKLHLKTTLQIVLAILIAISFAYNFYDSKIKSSEVVQFSQSPARNSIFRQLVYISGEVNNPGVYELSQDMRISEAIELAGGLTENADKIFLEKEVNLAKKVSDEEKIHIPHVLTTSSNTNGKINLNTATQKELEKLPGVGPVTATNIINNRPYKTLDNLTKIKGFTEKKITAIKDLVSL